MSVNKVQEPEARERSRCQIGHLSGNAPSWCAEAAREEVDCLLLCERHALEAKLEGQIECWGEMLFHIDLWSGVARRQDRAQIVELLDLERANATVAIERAYEDLEVLRRGGTLGGKVPSERGEIFRRDSLLLLPSGDAPQLSPGLREHRRR